MNVIYSKIKIRVTRFENGGHQIFLEYMISLKEQMFLTLLCTYIIDRPKVNLVSEKFSIIIPTNSRRIKALQEVLQSLLCLECSSLDKIFIYWNDFNKSNNITSELIHLQQKYNDKVVLLDTKYRNLNCRFHIPTELRTNTILSMDDDLLIDIDKIEEVFKAYISKKFTNSIAGPTYRKCTPKKYITKPGHKFNLILTNFAFLNVNHLIAYNSPKYNNQRKLVTKFNNCENILMNFIIENEFKSKPVRMDINFTDLGSRKGISLKPGHYNKRNSCCSQFNKQFGNNTLLYGDWL